MRNRSDHIDRRGDWEFSQANKKLHVEKSSLSHDSEKCRSQTLPQRNSIESKRRNSTQYQDLTKVIPKRLIARQVSSAIRPSGKLEHKQGKIEPFHMLIYPILSS